MKTKKTKEKETSFIVLFEDKTKQTLPAQEINRFIKTDKRKYTIVNADGEPVFKKSYQGR